MKLQSILAAAGCALGVAMLAAPAAQAQTSWALTGDIGCGGTFSGQFTTDPTGAATATNFIEVGGCTPGIYNSAQFLVQFGYGNLYGVTTSGFNVSSSIDGDNLFLVFENPLVGPKGTIDKLVVTQPDNSGSFKLDGYGDFIGITSGQAVALPEPAAWALMIGGFGLAGTVLRRRRAQIA